MEIGFPSSVGIKIGIHSAHHKFEDLGLRSHIQIILWEKGVSSSHWIRRFPIPWW